MGSIWEKKTMPTWGYSWKSCLFTFKFSLCKNTIFKNSSAYFLSGICFTLSKRTLSLLGLSSQQLQPSAFILTSVLQFPTTYERSIWPVTSAMHFKETGPAGSNRLKTGGLIAVAISSLLWNAVWCFIDHAQCMNSFV